MMECSYMANPNDVVVKDFLSIANELKIRLPIIVIYKHPSDYPDHYVARLWDVDRPTKYMSLAYTLEGARKSIPARSSKFNRQAGDVPTIVETWI